MQLGIDFTTHAPINKEKLKGQNKKVFEMLEKGSVTTYDAIRVGIYNLHSRISDLKNVVGIVIHSRFINREGSTIKEYSLKPFNSKQCQSKQN